MLTLRVAAGLRNLNGYNRRGAVLRRHRVAAGLRNLNGYNSALSGNA